MATWDLFVPGTAGVHTAPQAFAPAVSSARNALPALLKGHPIITPSSVPPGTLCR